ncbi:MAG TPA: FtsX-like permease family protein [Trebonia sp.]
MWTFTVRNLRARKRRLAATVLAVALGVAFLAGTLLLSDTLRANFGTLFTQANGGTDVIIRSATEISGGAGTSQRTGIDATLLPQVRAMPGVADAQPYIEGYGQLIGRDGKAIGGSGPPTRAANWISDRMLNPYRLVSGRAPLADDEAVINRGAAKSGHLSLGDTTTLLTPRPVQVRIVGIATFGTADGFGPTTFTGLTLHAAQADLTGSRPGQVTELLVQAAPGTSPDRLAQRLQDRLPTGLQAITGSQLAAEDLNAINSGFLGFLSTGLTAFAVIAVLVAAFSIYNTFSILATQRTRESALLRALGCSRRQRITAGLAEALAVGAAGAGIGWAGGIGIAALLKGVFDGFGFALPAGGLVLKASSSVLAVLVGLAAAILAGALPAVRSSRTPPLAALREVAAEPPFVSRRRVAAGALILAAGIATVIVGAVGASQGTAMAGAAATLAGFIMLGPAAVRPSAMMLGGSIALRGVTGRLARDNALRNPRRTAATASALLVGVAVAALFTVVGASMKATAASGVDHTLTADLVIDRGGYGGASGGGGLNPQLTADLGRLPGVRLATGLASGNAVLGGRASTITAADPAGIGRVLDLAVTRGSLRDLNPGSLAVSGKTAASRHWSVGSRVPITYPDGTTATLRVAAVFDHAEITGDYLLDQAGWAPHAGQDLDSAVFIKVAAGDSASTVRAAVTAAAASYGQPRVQDHAQYRASATSGVNTILGLVYVMLALAIVIALMGVANTLGLSIHERTRELGLLRAVGQQRRQARSMIRWESVIISVFGTVGGVALGTFLGWAVVKSSSSSTLGVFAAPPAQLVIFLVAGALAGVLAGLRPARRAARLDVLTAIAAT